VNGAFSSAVRDTGLRIPFAEQGKTFEEFHQADNSASIIEMHGGRIWVESSPGAGSTFFVSLPVNVQAQLEPK
jgi:signal transduction histidine kinase